MIACYNRASVDDLGATQRSFKRRMRAELLSCSTRQHHDQFAFLPGKVDAERLDEMSAGGLRSVIQGRRRVPRREFAMLLHEYVTLPKVGLFGLTFDVLDPDCPEVGSLFGDGIDLALNWLGREGFAVEGEHFDGLDEELLPRFLPSYSFPWSAEAQFWPSHVAALLVHLYKHPSLFTALLKPAE